MATKCFLCATGEQEMPKPTVSTHDTLGCCKLCHVFACGYHAHRDNTVPEYICSLCDPQLLTSSAQNYNSQSDSPTVTITATSSRYFISPSFFPYFKSLNDFIKRRPGYGDILLQSIQNYRLNTENPQYSVFYNDVTDEGAQELLIAAGVIVKFLYDEDYPDDLPEHLKFLAKNVSLQQRGYL